MAKFCKKCGTLMSDDERFCPKCGASGGSKVPTNSVVRMGAIKGKIVSLGVALVVIILGLIYFALLR